MVLRLLLLVLVSMPFISNAQEDCPPDKNPAAKLVQKVKGCPSSVDTKLLCAFVNAKETDENSANQFKYQTLILNASCVNESDSSATKKTKIQNFWNKYGKDLKCSSSSFGVSNGSIVKYAAYSGFDAFMYDVAKNWKVNLNHIDPSDGRTVLDYLKDEIHKNKGNAIEAKLQNYYDMLKLLGAKHKSDV